MSATDATESDTPGASRGGDGAEQPGPAPAPLAGAPAGLDGQLPVIDILQAAQSEFPNAAIDDVGGTTPPVHRVAIEKAVETSNPKANFKQITQRQLSWRIFLTVAILAGSIALFLAIFAFVTYPTLSEIQGATLTTSDTDPLEAWAQARSDWTQQFTGLAQTILFGSLVPLLATIAGYAIGERRGYSDDS